MNNQLQQFRDFLSSYTPISDDEWEIYSSLIRIREVKKKELILKEGEHCREVFFISSGLLRIFFSDTQGDEKTFHFAREGTLATDYECFLRSIPSNYSIQALEDTVVIIMSYEMLHAGFKILTNGEKLGRLIAEEYFFLFSNKIQTIYTKTPLQRYNDLLTDYPWITQRVPQHYIASYLNITSVHLSRLKNADRTD